MQPRALVPGGLGRSLLVTQLGQLNLSDGLHTGLLDQETDLPKRWPADPIVGPAPVTGPTPHAAAIQAPLRAGVQHGFLKCLPLVVCHAYREGCGLRLAQPEVQGLDAGRFFKRVIGRHIRAAPREIVGQDQALAVS